MRAASYRSKFLQVLDDVCDLSLHGHGRSDYRWTADYFSRYSRWYRFRGEGRESKNFTEGRMLDTDTGHLHRLSPSLLRFVMLEFDANELIAAYTGPLLPIVCIAQELVTASDTSREVLAITMERIEETDRRMIRKVMTSLMFVGFEHRKAARRVRDVLATSPDMVSPHWFHDRHMFLSRAAHAATYSRAERD